MMTLLGQWLGFSDSTNNTPTETTNNNNTNTNKSSSTTPTMSSSRPSQPGIRISSPTTKTPSSTTPTSSSSSNSSPRSPTNTSTLRKTKSDELLRDFEVMRFLCTVDERLKQQQMVLLPSQSERLQTLQAQAVVDDCPLLIDIIEHFEIEQDKLRHRLACAAPNSAAADAAQSRRNMLVF